MDGLLEFRVVMTGAETASERPISVLAYTPAIALYRGAEIAMDCNAGDFEIVPGRRSKHER